MAVIFEVNSADSRIVEIKLKVKYTEIFVSDIGNK